MTTINPKKTSPPPQTIIVLGMHRSGTSALMGALHQLGVDLGGQLLPIRDDNRLGFWENQAFVDFNRSILRAFKRKWHDVLPLPKYWWNQPTIDAKITELNDLLASQRSKTGLLGIKDPRLCRLLPIWKKVLKKNRVSPVYCMVIRHPLEVAASLTKRDGFSQAKGLLLWLDHVISAENYTRQETRAWVDYQKLLQQPASVLMGMAKQLQLPWSEFTPSQKKNVTSFLDPKLRNHTSDQNVSITTPLATRCMALFEKLRTEPESLATRKAIGKIRQEWRHSLAHFGDLILGREETLAAVQEEIETAKHHMDTLVSQLQVAKNIHDDQFTQIEHARAIHQRKDRQLETARQNIDHLQSDIKIASQVHSQKESEIDRARQNIATLEKQIEQARQGFAELQREIETLPRVNAQFKQSHDKNKGRLALANKEMVQARKNIHQLVEEIDVARQVHAAKDQQIEEARGNIALLQNELDVARQVHAAKDQQIEEARGNLALLQNELDVTRQAHATKDRQIEALGLAIKKHQDTYQSLISRISEAETVPNHALENAMVRIASQKEEIAQARVVHDQKVAEIARAREVHDQKDKHLDEARNNMLILKEQIDQARQAHRARDQIESELRREILQLRTQLARKSRSKSEPTLTPKLRDS